ncbi:MAG: hypothetical protein KJ069_09305 [Anaerolineae bacterium]|nr:hypothetical protein [Anaerolineae bacterium]
MSFPTIFDWLERFAFLRGYPAALAVLATAVIIVLAWEWRVAIVALAVQYLLLGLLYVDVLDPRLAVAKVLVGLFVCLILAITAGQVSWGRLPVDVLPAEAEQIKAEQRVRVGPLHVPVSGLLRLAAVAIMLLVVWALTERAGGLPLLMGTAVAPTAVYFELAVVGLLAFGLLAITISPEPMRIGMGVLMFLSGFELYFSALAQSAALLAALAALNLLTAVVISYLVQRRYAIPALLD